MKLDIDTEVFQSDPEIMSGWPAFVGTRVPIKNLFDYLAGGHNLDVFLDHFPGVTRDQAVAAIDFAREVVEAHAYSARRMRSEAAQGSLSWDRGLDSPRETVDGNSKRGVA
jgi:uncharacterized protein (DUF433 family)